MYEIRAYHPSINDVFVINIKSVKGKLKVGECLYLALKDKKLYANNKNGIRYGIVIEKSTFIKNIKYAWEMKDKLKFINLLKVIFDKWYKVKWILDDKDIELLFNDKNEVL